MPWPAGLPFILGFNVLRNFVTALSRPRAVLYTVLAMIFVNFVGNYIFIFGHFGAPALGLVGSGLSSAIANAFAFFVLLTVSLQGSRLRALPHSAPLPSPDWPKLDRDLPPRRVIGVTQLFEVTLFAASTFLMGQFGTAALAAHQIAINVPSITFMVPLGLDGGDGARGSRRGRGRRARHPARGRGGVRAGRRVHALCGIVLGAVPAHRRGPLPRRHAGERRMPSRWRRVFLRVAAAFQLFDGFR